MAVTDWPVEQKMRALGLANEVRLARSALRRRLRAMRTADASMELAVLVSECPAFVATMPVFELLAAARSDAKACRSVRDRALMRRAGLDPWSVTGRLTERQRTALARALRERGGR